MNDIEQLYARRPADMANLRLGQWLLFFLSEMLESLECTGSYTETGHLSEP